MAEDPHVEEHIYQLWWRGGILADEMVYPLSPEALLLTCTDNLQGLGKTMELVGLMLENPADEQRKDTDTHFITKATLGKPCSLLDSTWLMK